VQGVGKMGLRKRLVVGQYPARGNVNAKGLLVFQLPNNVELLPGQGAGEAGAETVAGRDAGQPVCGTK